MWPYNPIDIEVQRNASTPIGIRLVDRATKLPIDLSSLTGVKCTVKAAAGSGAALATPNATVVGPVLGLIDIIFTGSEFSAVAGVNEVVTLAYDVVATDSNSRIIVLLRGALYLSPGVS